MTKKEIYRRRQEDFWKKALFKKITKRCYICGFPLQYEKNHKLYPPVVRQPFCLGCYYKRQNIVSDRQNYDLIEDCGLYFVNFHYKYNISLRSYLFEDHVLHAFCINYNIPKKKRAIFNLHLNCCRSFFKGV